MENLIRISRSFYGIGLIGLAAQQFQYRDFRPVILPPWPQWLHATPLWSYLCSILLVIAGLIIFFGTKNRTVLLGTAGFFLFLFIAFHVPYLLLVNPDSPRHPGLWTNPLKELAFSGGAWVLAGLCRQQMHTGRKPYIIALSEKCIPAGRIFFSITMIVFGIDHFLYTDFVSGLVPAWIPGPVSWTYFSGIALIGSGLCIIFRIKMKLVASLLAWMIFLWFIFLHIPRAIAHPYMDDGNEISSVFEALAFSGIAMAIAYIPKNNSIPVETALTLN